MASDELAFVSGLSGNLGPLWCNALREMEYRVHGCDLPLCDVSDRDRVAYIVRRCIAVHGIPRVIVLNAAADYPATSMANFHDNFQSIMEVNVLGAYNIVEAFLSMMIESGGGVIVGITSIYSMVGPDPSIYPDGFEKPVAYGMSKAALNQYMRHLTTQYGHKGIRACCIGLGCYDSGNLDPTFTEKYLQNVPLERLVSKESAKAALKFVLTCPEFSGQTLFVEGGYLSK